MMMTRQQVYATLDSERLYQDAMSMSSMRPDMVQEMSMGEIILAMEHCLFEAKKAWYSDAKPYPKTTEYLRKVGGLTVKAGEQFGFPFRSF